MSPELVRGTHRILLPAIHPHDAPPLAIDGIIVDACPAPRQLGAIGSTTRAAEPLRVTHTPLLPPVETARRVHRAHPRRADTASWVEPFSFETDLVDARLRPRCASRSQAGHPRGRRRLQLLRGSRFDRGVFAMQCGRGCGLGLVVMNPHRLGFFSGPRPRFGRRPRTARRDQRQHHRRYPHSTHHLLLHGHTPTSQRHRPPRRGPRRPRSNCQADAMKPRKAAAIVGSARRQGCRPTPSGCRPDSPTAAAGPPQPSPLSRAATAPVASQACIFQVPR